MIHVFIELKFDVRVLYVFCLFVIIVEVMQWNESQLEQVKLTFGERMQKRWKYVFSSESFLKKYVQNVWNCRRFFTFILLYLGFNIYRSPKLPLKFGFLALRML